jgi:hypothetical protein
MLTINNVRKDIGHQSGFELGRYKLVDGGLSNENPISILGNYPYYTFYWAFKDDRYDERTVKVVLPRKPVGQIAEYKYLNGIHYEIAYYRRVKDISISNPVSGWERFWIDVVSRETMMDATRFYNAMVRVMEKEKKQWHIEK